MTTIVDEVHTANLNYSRSFGEKAKLGLPPARRFAILTCMDARLDPAKYAGLAEGDAHVIRNAGGRATDDAIRSLVISYKLLGTRAAPATWSRTISRFTGISTTSDRAACPRLNKPRG
jgi:carbonic anhydrase